MNSEELVARAIEQAAVSNVSPAECFELLARAEGLFEDRKWLAEAEAEVERLKAAGNEALKAQREYTRIMLDPAMGPEARMDAADVKNKALDRWAESGGGK